MFDPLAALDQYLRCQSVSADPQFSQGMVAARDFLQNLFTKMGLSCSIVETPVHPIVMAKRIGPAEWPHIVIYGHYDVQPADPLELWETPPFEPSIRDGRLYARGAADNKGPFMAHLAAVAALLRDYADLPLRITFIVEGEEEIGSPSFVRFLQEHKEELRANFVLLSDTMSSSADQICITTGLRGLFTLELELTGPQCDLHSGLHGGAVRNPIQALVTLLASLHTPDGHVNVPGFYDGVEEPTAFERAQIAQLPDTEADYQKLTGVPAFFSPSGFSPQEASRFLPTLEYNGITGGYQGIGAKTIIPSKASVKISARLVEGQQAASVRAAVIKAIEDRLPSGVRLSIKVGNGGNPYCVHPPAHPKGTQNPILAKGFQAADQAITEVFGCSPLYVPEGGSIPIIQHIREITGMDSIMIGLFSSDSAIHSPNENFDLRFLEKGQKAIYKLLFTLTCI